MLSCYRPFSVPGQLRIEARAGSAKSPSYIANHPYTHQAAAALVVNFRDRYTRYTLPFCFAVFLTQGIFCRGQHISRARRGERIWDAFAVRAVCDVFCLREIAATRSFNRCGNVCWMYIRDACLLEMKEIACGLSGDGRGEGCDIFSLGEERMDVSCIIICKCRP